MSKAYARTRCSVSFDLPQRRAVSLRSPEQTPRTRRQGLRHVSLLLRRSTWDLCDVLMPGHPGLGGGWRRGARSTKKCGELGGGGKGKGESVMR